MLSLAQVDVQGWMGAMRIAIVDDIAQERALFRARFDEALMKRGVQAEIV